MNKHFITSYLLLYMSQRIIESAKRGWDQIRNMSAPAVPEYMQRQSGGMFGENDDDYDEDEQSNQRRRVYLEQQAASAENTEENENEDERQVDVEDEEEEADDDGDYSSQYYEDEEQADQEYEEAQAENKAPPENPGRALANTEAAKLGAKLSKKYNLPISVAPNAVYTGTGKAAGAKQRKKNTKQGDLNSGTGEFSKSGNQLSKYQVFMKLRLPQIKAENPDMDHKVAFRQAAADWKPYQQYLLEHP